MASSVAPAPATVTFPRPWMLLIVAAVIAAMTGAMLLLTIHPAPGIRASGTIEATQSDVAPKVQGRLAALRVRDGDFVRAGQVLATLEQRTPALAAAQARADITAAAAQVAAARAAYELQVRTYATTLAQARSGVGIAGSRLGQAGENLSIEQSAATLGVDQARAQLSVAQAAEARARVVFARVRNLVASGDVAQQQLDDATAAEVSAQAQVRAARDALALAQAQQRTVRVRALDVDASRLAHLQSLSVLASAEAEAQLVDQRRAQLAAAQGALAQAQAALGLAQDQVRETSLVAPYDGVVLSHNFEVGDLVQPGAAVLTVADLAHPYLYVYVSEVDLPRIKPGMQAAVTIDGLHARTFTGTVTEINNVAEFTPENVQTQSQRIEYLVFRVKLQFSDTTGALKPGLPADAVIAL